MPTPAEQKALAFVALVILLGGAVRISRAVGAPSADRAIPADDNGLVRQTFSAESAADAEGATRARKRRGGDPKARKSRDAGASASSNGAKPTELDRFGFPPPAPRIDIPPRVELPTYRTAAAISPAVAEAPQRPRAERRASRPSMPAPLLDLDRAAAAEIEALPRIGPAIARRIVASRDSLGPFGSLAALGRVKGVGPATLERIAHLVTFSGQARR